MEAIFEPINGTNKSESIVLQIEAAIVGGNFKAGDKLPSERDLQNLFETSRHSIREALHSLRDKGLLETKKGVKGGYYVKEVDINESIDQLAIMMKNQSVPLGKLLEFQYAMDKAVLYSAVNNATEEELNHMTDLAKQLVKVCNRKKPDYKQIANLDNKLNLIMVEMTRNPFFEWVMRTVQVSFRDYEFIVYKTPEIRSQIGENWLSTAIAVKDKDIQKALRLYAHWYIILEQCLKKEHGEDILTRSTERAPD